MRTVGFLDARDGNQSDFFFELLEVCDQKRKQRQQLLDDATMVAVIAAPMLAYDVQRMRHRLQSKDVRASIPAQQEDIPYHGCRSRATIPRKNWKS